MQIAGDRFDTPDLIDADIIRYKMSPTGKRFHRSNAPMRGMMGPIGSGKSVTCCFEIFRRMIQQEVGTSGYRLSRWAVVRSTYPELETTTARTWLDWFPEEIFGRFNWKPPFRHNIEFNDIRSEVMFLALDRPDDVKKLLSIEFTGIWINEARESAIEIIRGASDRVGRYPSMREKPDHIPKKNWPTWYGIIMDTNPPEDDHWWAVYAGDAPWPEDWEKPYMKWEFFHQPPAAFERKVDGKTVWELNPKAENLENLPEDYYRNAMDGKPNNHIRVYVGAQYGSSMDKKPVYGDSYNDETHVASKDIEPSPNSTIIVGIDCGNTPAACFSQKDAHGRWIDFDELVTHGVSAQQFARLLKLQCGQYPNFQFEFWGDPAGADKLQGQEHTYFDILNAEGIKVRPAPMLKNNDPSMRREAGEAPLLRMVNGGPGYMLSPKCKYLRKGFKGGYGFKRMNVSGVVRYSEKPDKNIYSHIHEARQYGYCGGGEVREVTGRTSNRQRGPIKAKMGIKPLGRYGAR